MWQKTFWLTFLVHSVIGCIRQLYTLRYHVEYMCVLQGKSCVWLPCCNSLLQRACSATGRWSLCCQRSDSRSASNVLAAAAVNVLITYLRMLYFSTHFCCNFSTNFSKFCIDVFPESSLFWIAGQVVAFKLSLVWLGKNRQLFAEIYLYDSVSVCCSNGVITYPLYYHKVLQTRV